MYRTLFDPTKIPSELRRYFDEVEVKCGAPMRRVVERPRPPREEGKPVPASERDGGITAEDGLERTGLSHFKYDEWLRANGAKTAGWAPTCGCGGTAMEPDDLELIESPLGSVQEPDPSLETGRAGYNRPRAEGEGKSSMTRWEQREIAQQLRESPHRAEMEEEAGKEAFAHYIRTDRSGARAVPAGLLDKWEILYDIGREEPPMKAPPLVPCVVLDPFMGSGTTALVALKAGRNFIGIELKPEYVALANQRIKPLLEQGRLF